eukprot:257177_1
MTFPLFIINLSFMLETYDEYKNISIFNLLQFIFALFTLSVSPFTNLLSVKIKFFMMDGIALTFQDKFKLYSIISFTLIPTLLVEIIHFFPILFAYYIDDILNYRDILWILLLLFNVPKTLFVIHITKKYWHLPAFADTGIIGKIIFTVILTIIFFTLPLVPYFIAMLFKDKYKRTNSSNNKKKTIFFDGLCSSTSRYYWNVVAYLWISYIGSSAYLLYRINIHNMSNPLLISLLIVLCLCIFITVSIPRLFYDFHRYFGQ